MSRAEHASLHRHRTRRPRPRRGTGALWTLVLIAVLAAAACGGGSDGGGDGGQGPATAEFVPSATAPSPDLMLLRGTAIDDDTIDIEIVIGGPSSSDICNFAIDLLVSEGNFVDVVDGSAEPGDGWDGPASDYSANVSQQGQRIVTGVSKLGCGPGEGEQFDGTENAVLGFRIDLLRTGGADLEFDAAQSGAEDSNGNPVGISFDSEPAQVLLQ